MEGAKKRAPLPKPPMTMPVASPFLKQETESANFFVWGRIASPFWEPVNDGLNRRRVHRSISQCNQTNGGIEGWQIVMHDACLLPKCFHKTLRLLSPLHWRSLCWQSDSPGPWLSCGEWQGQARNRNPPLAAPWPRSGGPLAKSSCSQPSSS